MFSSTTIASSTTKPVAMVSAISDRLSRLKPSRYIAAERADDARAARPRRDQRRADVAQEQEHDHRDQHDRDHQRALGVAQRGADGRACGRWRWSMSMSAGIAACSCGSAAFTLSTVSMMLAPGWRNRITSTAGLPLDRPALRRFSTESVDVGDVGQPHRARRCGRR